MHADFKNIISKLECNLIRNPNYMLLLGVFNCAILLNFHLAIWTNTILFVLIFSAVGLTFLSYKWWWATIINIVLSFFVFAIKFPRLANHSNLEFFIEIVILGLLIYKIINPKFKIAPNILSAVFRVSVVTIYFYTGFHKLNTDYFNPCVSCVNEINEYIFKNFTGIKLTLPEQFSYFFAYSSVFVEFILPFGLLWHKTRKWTAILLLFFHFYLNFAVYADFSALASFLILGCVIDFESKTIPKKVINAFRLYVLFTSLAILANYIILKYQIHIKSRGFIHGLVFNIGWFIFFFIYFKNYQAKVLRFDKKPVLLLSICFVMISFWTLRTYIGLGNTGNFTMFSNVLTEKSRSNHFIIDTKNSKLFDFEEDNILILKLPDTLKNNKLENFKLPLIEFKFKSTEWCKKYDTKLNCTVVYKNDTIIVPDLKNSIFNEKKWWYKYLLFRKIQPEGPNECYW